ncbi:NRDE family protein [Arenicella sp. 4NH20-0111]|uniref:NRDE family protein n=1 Tax=Arenicella sp. 4NH20-0111 TaxID=3127648 RepID=UPI0033407201
MCTMTWFVNEDGYELFFNRDERLTRRRASLPAIQKHDLQDDRTLYISPTDADAGGTWIATNEYGVTVCLLNHYQFEQIETYKKWISRGEIVRRFSSILQLHEADQLFDGMNLEDYRAFRMFIIEPNGANRLMVWDGHAARIESDVTKPKSSSSVDAQNVKALRRQLFAEMGLENSRSAQDYIRFHSSHEPSRSKDSVCMHREDAQTVSLSYVKVDRHSVNFCYADGSPCEVALSKPMTLALRSRDSLSLAAVSCSS